MRNDQPHKKESGPCSCCKCRWKWYGLVLKWCLNIWILELLKTHTGISQHIRSMAGTCTKHFTHQRRYTTTVLTNSPFLNYHKWRANRKTIIWSNFLTLRSILFCPNTLTEQYGRIIFGTKEQTICQDSKTRSVLREYALDFCGVLWDRSKYTKCRKLTSAYVYTSL